MKEFDEFDKKIENILKADIYEPDSYTNTIMHALDKKNRRKLINFPKLVAAIIAGAMLISGVVYAKQIGEFIKRFFNENKGTDRAVEYGYIETPNKSFDTKSNIGVKITNIIIDDYNINFILDFTFNDDFKEGSSLIIPDLIITDEFNNILFCKDEQKFNEFCNKNNLNFDFYEFNKKYQNTSIYRNQTFSEKQISYNVKSTTPFPKSKKLFIEFTHIIVTMDNGDVKEMYDKWETEIDISNMIYKRKTNNYTMIYTNEPSINSFRFETFSTGTILEIDAKFKPYITDDMEEEDKEQRMKNFFEDGLKYVLESKNRVYNIIIQNSNGEMFYPASSNIDDKEIRYSYDGIFHYEVTLDLTQYDLTDTLTLSFTIQTIDEDRDVVVKLQKEK